MDLTRAIPPKTLFAIAGTVFIGVAAGLIIWLWPNNEYPIDPEQTPFIGSGESNAYTIYTRTVTDASGRFRAHKVVILLIGLALIAGGLGWIAKGIQSWKGKVFWPVGRRWTKSKLFFMTVSFFVLLPLFLGLRKIPDFSASSDYQMATANMHFAFIMGHADKIAQGDKLYDQVTPKYGMLFTALIAGLEKTNATLMPLGSILRLAQAADLIFLLTALILYWRWSGRRPLLCVIPVLLLLKWFYSSSEVLIPLNHTSIRTAGITFAAFSLYFLRTKNPIIIGTIAGVLSALALLNNVESGVAASAGLAVFLFYRSRVDFHPFNSILKMLFCGMVGFVSFWSLFSFVFYLLFGSPFGLRGLEEYLFPSFKGASGAWATNDPLTFWPLFMFFHMVFFVLQASASNHMGFPRAFRLAIGVMFLVWFVYFVNRPHPVYLCSFFFLYGIAVIDLQKRLIRSTQRQIYLKPQTLVIAGAFLIIGHQAAESVLWGLNPWKWKINNSKRWQVPLVKKGKPFAPSAVKISHVYFPQPYAHSLVMRGNYLKVKKQESKSQRLIYFTPDSFLLPRVSGVLPWQEFPDPLEAMTKHHYDKLIQSVIQSPFQEIYFDARDMKPIVYYPGLFQKLRQDLSGHFKLSTVDSEWEIWKRIPAAP